MCRADESRKKRGLVDAKQRLAYGVHPRFELLAQAPIQKIPPCAKQVDSGEM
jgi:hypothetical protein